MYENASDTVIEVKDESEPDEFLKIWFDQEKLKNLDFKRLSDILPEYNHWYKDVKLL